VIFPGQTIRNSMVQTEYDILALIKSKTTRKKGFSLLVGRYQEPLYWTIRRMLISHEDSRDVLQETFIRIWKNLDGYRQESKIFSWIYRIAINETFRFMEKKSKLIEGSMDLEEVMVQELERDKWINADEAEKKLQKAVLSLPTEQRMVVNMRYFDEMKYDEIAEILGTEVVSSTNKCLVTI